MGILMNIERATMQRWVQSYQRRLMQRAVLQAYAEFARSYPEAVAALFDAHFVKTHVLPTLMRAANEGNKVTATQIAEMWARQVSIMPVLRQKHTTRMIPVATHFLCMAADELADIQVGRNANSLNLNVFGETAVG